jgi:hypothetical protein
MVAHPIKPETHNGNLAALVTSAAWGPLTRERRWVCWSWELSKSGKWTKVPKRPDAPERNASTTDSETWGSFLQALACVTAKRADGIGIVLTGPSIGALDLDHCRDDANDSGLAGWARDIWAEAERVGWYREVTVSGKGLRIIGSTNGGVEIHRKFPVDGNGGQIELFRNARRYITVSGAQVGPCDGLAPIDGFIEGLLARFDAPSQPRQGPGINLNDIGPQEGAPGGADFEDIIRNGKPHGERSEAFQAAVWHLAGKGKTEAEIIEELRKHPNGIVGKYRDRLEEEVHRSYGKWERQRRASATGTAAEADAEEPDEWPTIIIRPGEEPRAINEAEEAILKLPIARREIYQRGSFVVRPGIVKHRAADGGITHEWRLIEVGMPYLMYDVLPRAAKFVKPGRGRTLKQISCPAAIAAGYLSREAKWRLPVIAGVATTPVMRPDGSILDRPGYDAETGLIYNPGGVEFPAIPEQPTLDDALAALDYLKQTISTFPFASRNDLSVALSGFPTPMCRRFLPSAPLHAFTAPTARTGKSKLVNGYAIVVNGEEMSIMSPSNDDKEMDKQLGAELLAGASMLSLDNWDRPIQSARLCQILTEKLIAYRVFVVNETRKVPTYVMMYATGNNLVVRGDVSLRTLMGMIDAKCAHPEQRVFANNYVDMVRERRPQLVVAILVVLKAWHLARRRGTEMECQPFGGFEDWSRWVREALLWLGEADPVATAERVQETDPEREALEEVTEYWEQQLGLGVRYRGHEILSRAMGSPDFYAALVSACGTRGNVDAKRLGEWLRFQVGKITSAGCKIVSERGSRGSKWWKLVRE